MKKHSALFLSMVLSAGLVALHLPCVHGENAVRIFVVPVSRFLSSPDENPPIVERAYISRTYFHIAENLHEDRTMPSYAGRYSFTVFRIVDGRYYRDLFFISNPEGIRENGFYSIEYRILKSGVRSGLRTNEVLLSRVAKLPESIEDIDAALKRILTERSSSLVPGNLSSLRAFYGNLSPRNNIRGSLFPAKGVRSGINAKEYLGYFGGRYLYRLFLSNADDEKYKRENTVARGYFMYVSFDYEGNSCDCYYTVVDYSVYTK